MAKGRKKSPAEKAGNMSDYSLQLSRIGLAKAAKLMTEAEQRDIFVEAQKAEERQSELRKRTKTYRSLMQLLHRDLSDGENMQGRYLVNGVEIDFTLIFHPPNSGRNQD